MVLEVYSSEARSLLVPGLKGATDQAHQCVIIIFLFAPIVRLLGTSHAHAMVVRHRVGRMKRSV